MRFRHRDGGAVHLSYCSNVHPADDLDGVLAQLDRYAGPVRETLEAPRLGLGLWLAAPAAARVSEDPAALEKLRSRLEAHRLEVVTFNGFPYEAFHAPVVKKAVYFPDWTDPARADYTLALARILAALLPEGVDSGSISTVPLGWREGWTEASRDAARRALGRVAEGLKNLEAQTGKTIRVALEPEPGCAAETTEGVVAALRGVDPEWVGVCLDACHLAVQFEKPEEAIKLLREAGVPLVKAQLSSALRVGRPRELAGRDWIARFAEPRFLHQTRELVDGSVAGVDDLPEALAGALPGEGEWRVHFHVPVHHPGAETTQAELSRFLDALLSGEGPATAHLEVETYTWSVLPDGERPADERGLVEGLAREVFWTRERLIALGLEEESP